MTGAQSPLRWPLDRGPFKIGNRIAVQPMEGWDAAPDGAPSEKTFRRWQRFGRSGGKLIWGGEAAGLSLVRPAEPQPPPPPPPTPPNPSQTRACFMAAQTITTRF